MRIGELSGRTGVPARLLRYYEEQDLLLPERDSNGYRSYAAADVYRVQQIRGLLDSGLTTEIIRRILPFLDCGIHLPAQCLTAETAELLEREAERLGQRIDCLSRNRDALLGYLAAVRGAARHPSAGSSGHRLSACHLRPESSGIGKCHPSAEAPASVMSAIRVAITAQIALEPRRLTGPGGGV